MKKSSPSANFLLPISMTIRQIVSNSNVAMKRMSWCRSKWCTFLRCYVIFVRSCKVFKKVSVEMKYFKIHEMERLHMCRLSLRLYSDFQHVFRSKFTSPEEMILSWSNRLNNFFGTRNVFLGQQSFLSEVRKPIILFSWNDQQYSSCVFLRMCEFLVTHFLCNWFHKTQINFVKTNIHKSQIFN